MDRQPDIHRGRQNGKFYLELTAALAAAVRWEIRYNTKDHNGQTRAERNELAGVEKKDAPEVPEHGTRLWLMFWKLNSLRVERNRIRPSEIADWLRLHGQKIATVEMQAIEAMDRAFINTLTEEIGFNEERRKATKGK